MTANADFDVLEPGWVEVSDGAITAVNATPPDESIGLDLSGRVLLPGLVNTHAHMFQTLLRGMFEGLTLAEFLPRVYSTGIVYTPADSRIAARLGAYESLRSGVTTILDHHFLNRGNDLAVATLDGLRSMGLRTALARTIMDGGSMTPTPLKEPAEVGVKHVEELLTTYQDDIEKGHVAVLTGPNTPGVNVSPEGIQATSEFARSAGLHQSMHVAEHPSIVKLVGDRYGADGVIDLLARLDALDPRVIAAHAVHVSDEEIRLMAGAGASVSHNPISNLMAGDGVAPITRMRTAGIPVGVGTDGPASAYHMDLLEPMRLTAALQRGVEDDAGSVTSQAAIRMVTSEAAAAIGLDHLVGSIEVGKRADLVALDLEGPHNVGHHNLTAQLVFAAKPENVTHVMVDGKLLLQDRELVETDPGQVMAEANVASRRVAKLI